MSLYGFCVDVHCYCNVVHNVSDTVTDMINHSQHDSMFVFSIISIMSIRHTLSVLVMELLLVCIKQSKSFCITFQGICTVHALMGLVFNSVLTSILYPLEFLNFHHSHWLKYTCFESTILRLPLQCQWVSLKDVVISISTKQQQNM